MGVRNLFHMRLEHNFHIKRQLKCHLIQNHHVNGMAALMAARIICYPAYMKWSIFTYISLRKPHMGIIEAKPMFQKGAAISAAIK